MKQRLFLTVFLLLAISGLTVFAGGPDFDRVNVGAATINCLGDVSISVTLDWNYATSANWYLSIDGIQINSGVVNRANPVDSFTFTGIITPKIDPSVAVDLRIQSFGGNWYDQTHTRFARARVCRGGAAETEPVVICDDGRLNTACDTVAIYAIEDFEGIHMQVWYVVPGDGVNGQFAFMLYQDELDALPDNPAEAMLIASSEDGFINLYWLPDNSFQLNAGPDSEGKTRVFIFTSFPGEITSYTLES